jgi:hypothetical protein
MTPDFRFFGSHFSFKIGSPYWKHSELFFEKKQLIPVFQQLLVSYSKPAA